MKHLPCAVQWERSEAHASRIHGLTDRATCATIATFIDMILLHCRCSDEALRTRSQEHPHEQAALERCDPCLMLSASYRTRSRSWLQTR